MKILDTISFRKSHRHQNDNGQLNRSAARAFALAASSSRFLGGALVSIATSNLAEAAATSSTASLNAASFAFEGLVVPLILRTYCSAAARISCSVTGGSKLKRVRIFLHMISLPAARTVSFLSVSAPRRPAMRQAQHRRHFSVGRG